MYFKIFFAYAKKIYTYLFFLCFIWIMLYESLYILFESYYAFLFVLDWFMSCKLCVWSNTQMNFEIFIGKLYWLLF